MRWFFRYAVVSTVLLSGTVGAQETASAYPTKPVVVVAGIAAGGPIDREARLYTAKIATYLGQQFILDFKPGGAGTIGAGHVAKAKPDGYTLLVVSAGFTVFPAFYKNLPFDIITDFAPISVMSERTSVLQVHPAFLAKTFAEYVAYAKAHPGKVNYGTTGAGGIAHLAGAWLHSATNTSVTFVPYKGTGILLLELVAGRIDVASGTLISALPLIKAGKTRALAILNDQRSKLLPDVPTVAEQGVPGYNYSNWIGFLAPSATPPAIISKLREAFVKVAHAPDIAAQLEAAGSIPVGSTPAEFRQLIISETARWQKVVKETGTKLE